MTPDADRRAPACSHRPPCPGCPRFGEPTIAHGARAMLDALARTHGLPPAEVAGGALVGFRHRARLAIRGRREAPKLGLFEAGSHRLVHIPNCQVHHPLINRVADVVRRALIDTGVDCYSEAAHRGLARYLQVVIERRSQTAQVVVVGNAARVEPFAALLDAIRGRLGAQLHSLWFNAHPERSNAVLGREFHHWCGPASLVEHYGGAEVHYPPGAFGQSHPEIAERIVAHVRDRIPPGAHVAEFYGGVGAIGLSVLDRVVSLRINEVAVESLRGLALGLARLDRDARDKVSVWPGTAASAAPAAHDRTVVIADPPRKGLDPALIATLRSSPPRRFVYVSCELRTLIADAARLAAGGGFRLESLAAFNQFPYTEHVETVATFDRRG